MAQIRIQIRIHSQIGFRLEYTARGRDHFDFKSPSIHSKEAYYRQGLGQALHSGVDQGPDQKQGVNRLKRALLYTQKSPNVHSKEPCCDRKRVLLIHIILLCIHGHGHIHMYTPAYAHITLTTCVGRETWVGGLEGGGWKGQWAAGQCAAGAFKSQCACGGSTSSPCLSVGHKLECRASNLSVEP